MSNERSACSGNFDWPAFGDEVNHQCSKGWQAERALAELRAPRGGARSPSSRCCGRTPSWRSARAFAACPPTTPPSRAAMPPSASTSPPRRRLVRRLPQVPLRVPRPRPVHRRARPASRSSARDLLDGPEQTAGLRAILAGIEAEKPFECVGEIDESRAALRAAGRLARVGRSPPSSPPLARRLPAVPTPARRARGWRPAATTSIPERHAAGHRCVSRSLRAGGSASGALGREGRGVARALARARRHAPGRGHRRARARRTRRLLGGRRWWADAGARSPRCDVVVRSPGHQPPSARGGGPARGRGAR